MFEVDSVKKRPCRAGSTRQGGRSVSSPTRYRLLFAIQHYFEFGGLQRDMLQIASVCAEQGHDVQIVTGTWKGNPPENIQVHLVDCHARTNHGRCEAFGKSVQEFTRQMPFDCIAGFSKIPGLDVYWCGDPCLAVRLQEEKPRFATWLPRYRSYLRSERLVFEKTGKTELLVLSQPEWDRIKTHYDTAESRMHLMPGGVDRKRFDQNLNARTYREQIRKELGIAESALMFLTVGSSFKTKGVDRSIRALASLPAELRDQAQLVVVGNGNPVPFQKLADRLILSNQVHFTGGRSDVARFYQAADILLHPARTETAGHILLEAMVCGLPVIVTENCGNAYHVERAGAGQLSPHPFSQRMFNQLLPLAFESNDRDQWKQKALTYSATTDLYGMVDKAAEVIMARAERNQVRTT